MNMVWRAELSQSPVGDLYHHPYIYCLLESSKCCTARTVDLWLKVCPFHFDGWTSSSLGPAVTHVSFLLPCTSTKTVFKHPDQSPWVVLQLAINGPGWKLMLALRRQRDNVYLAKVMNGWQSVAAHDKSKVLLRMFVDKREFRVQQLHFQLWRVSARGALE